MGGLGLSGKYQPFIFIFLLLFSHSAAAAAAKSLQSCPTLHDSRDCSPPVSSTHGIFQTRVLEWVAIAFSGFRMGASHKWGNCCCEVASVMSNSVRLHRRQPTRLPCPWDSPGKNTGVGCHFPLQCMKVKSEREVTQSCPTLATPWTAAHQAPPSMGFSRQKYWNGVIVTIIR